MSVPQNPIVPQCKALLLCDQAIVEEDTRRISLINILTDFDLLEFPGKTPRMTLFVQIADAEGRYEIAVEIHDLKNDVVVGAMPPLELEVDDRLAPVSLLLPISPIPLLHPGAYDVIVVVDGHELEHQQFLATLIEDD